MEASVHADRADRIAPPEASPARRGLAILIVEDHADSAVSLATLLRHYGHSVDVAFDGPSALRLARQRPPDVALLDLYLREGMDGWEVAHFLKQQPGPKRPLLIAMTGYTREEDRQRSSAAGIDLHLIKPVDPTLLEELLRRFLAIVQE